MSCTFSWKYHQLKNTVRLKLKYYMLLCRKISAGKISGIFLSNKYHTFVRIKKNNAKSF